MLNNPVPQKRELVKSLLLSFLVCSSCGKLKTEKLPQVTSHHLTALHAFAQWQCVYHDAMSLNYLSREPFPTTSPACLYTGEVAMYYALISMEKEKWLDDIFIAKDSVEWRLFNKFLYLVTGQDEEGRKGKHGISNDWTRVR